MPVANQHHKQVKLTYFSLHDNITLYEELEACWTITSEADLKTALLSLKRDKKKVPYTDQNIDRFLSEIIYGGRSERDVLGDYERFIANISMQA
jgi:hypothetical protein